MINIAVDRSRISAHLKASVTVVSDEPIYAYEARATLVGSAFGKGIGHDLISDDASAVSGVVSLPSPVTSFSFDVENTELSSDGNYRISVYVKNADGVWNDVCGLLTSDRKQIVDSDGKTVFAKRNGSGTDTEYVSAYSGAVINNFVTEVIA